MENTEHRVDAYIKNKLENMDIMPPEDVWQGVVQRLDHKRRIPPITLFSVLAAGIALMIGIGWVLIVNPVHQKKIALQVERKKSSQALSVPLANTLPKKPLPLKITDIPDDHHFSKAESSPLKPGDRSQGSGARDQGPEVRDQGSGARDLGPGVRSLGSRTRDQGAEGMGQGSGARDLDTVQITWLTVLIPKEGRLENTTVSINLWQEPSFRMGTGNQRLTADENKTEEPKVRHWSIQGQIAPMYAYRSISQTGSDYSKSELNNEESGLMAYSAMIKVNYQVNKNISIQTGIGYSMYGYANNNSNNYEYQEMGPSASSFNQLSNATPNYNIQTYYVINSSLYSTHQNRITTQSASDHIIYAASNTNGMIKINGEFIQQMRFLEIPLLIRYRFLERKLSLHMVGGLGTQVLVSSTGYMTNGSSVNNVYNSLPIQQLYLNGTLGIGLNYRLPNQAVIVIEPTYKYFINPVNYSNNFIHPYAFGIFTGLDFNF